MLFHSCFLCLQSYLLKKLDFHIHIPFLERLTSTASEAVGGRSTLVLKTSKSDIRKTQNILETSMASVVDIIERSWMILKALLMQN